MDRTQSLKQSDTARYAPWKRATLIACMQAFFAAGCGDGAQQSNTGPDGSDTSSLVGGWSGINDMVVDGPKEFCFVFCANGRYFSGDNTQGCTQGTGDFDTYLTYQVEGEQIRLSDAAGEIGVMSAERVDADHATFRTDSSGQTYVFEMTRVVDTVPECTSDGVSLRPRG